MPAVCSGVALRRHGPGDWMLPGQFTTAEALTTPSNSSRSALPSLASV
ncbi:hypothetical protein [Mycolicibacterium vanbaalenii]|nr:hypothetical protein [Mycolicibacterium vanbaalenii]